jgi:hypothetical protein
MAKHKIFIGDFGVGKMRLGDSRSTDYNYDSETGVLHLYWRGEEVAICKNVKAGDAFLVICGGGMPEISEMHFPKHPNDFLLYILGFNNGTRCHRWDWFERALKEQRKLKYAADRSEYSYSGPHYEFHVLEDKEGKPYHLAAMIDADLTAEEYCNILCEWPYEVRYPNEFLRVSFKQRLGMNAGQINKVFEEWGIQNTGRD